MDDNEMLHNKPKLMQSNRSAAAFIMREISSAWSTTIWCKIQNSYSSIWTILLLFKKIKVI